MLGDSERPPLVTVQVPVRVVVAFRLQALLAPRSQLPQGQLSVVPMQRYAGFSGSWAGLGLAPLNVTGRGDAAGGGPWACCVWLWPWSWVSAAGPRGQGCGS